MSPPDRRTLWHRHCRCGAPTPDLCACIDVCVCGCLRVQHAYDYATDTGEHYGVCETTGCGCPRFELDEEALDEEARCAKCGAPKWRHCEFDEPGLDHPADCDRMHHEFKPIPAHVHVIPEGV